MFVDFNIIIILLGSLVVFTGAIAFLRVLFEAIYATGNPQDTFLLGLMKQESIPNWQTLQQKAEISSTTLWQLRDGQVASIKLSELAQVAKALSIPFYDFLEKLDVLPPHPELEARRKECLELQKQLQSLAKEKDALRQEGMRLHEELQQQRTELTNEFRTATFEKLQTLLSNYPSIYQMVSVKPELPAKNVLSMFTPLENLLKEWDYEQIGKPWEQVSYNPQIHQPDASDMTEGEMVYIRFVGYRNKEDILCPAKVSRTLPVGGR
ncbi:MULTISPECIES: helix-turn-helix domain-containing protein [Nostocales]|uniref:Helix-turn-helix domain-containing protein n=3 Tax=Nostocales TaxID=1161 RepID=A0A8S9SXK2_9CYAN|nr:helix-turn-helix domain-containing protein [Tolypothrix bouteillei]KAF3884890.1 helix-turn-helix domain-containing protein [Tolypothrix bouteillei VB521301]